MPATINDILRAIEQQRGLHWVAVPDRDGAGVVISERLAIAGPHQMQRLFFPDTGEVAEYATLVFEDAADPRG